MRKCTVAILVLVVLAGCGGSPSPTPDIAATQVALEEGAHATMTAQAPTFTPTPLPTNTATATATPTPTATPTNTPTPTIMPTPTDTASPTNTPTPSMTPLPLPKGWVSYEQKYRAFGFAHPSTWKVDEQWPSGLSLRVPSVGSASIGLLGRVCGIGAGEDTSAAQTCLATTAVEWAEEKVGTSTVIRTTVWEEGLYRIYVVELTIYRADDRSTEYWIQTFNALPGHPWDIISAVYAKWGATTITDQEREQMRLLVKSVRVR